LADLTDELEQTGVGKKVQLKLRRDNGTTSIDVDVIDIGRGP
jgi:hypothetical protein